MSPLSNRYLKYNYLDEEWLDIWSDRIVRIADDLKYDTIFLIPHVINDDNTGDDDYLYLSKIYDRIKNDRNVVLLPKNVGFCGIKEYLVQCDVIFAARMHCAVNSISCGVPTIFLSYSPKSVGMCKHVYNNMDWVIDMNKLCEKYDSELIKSFEKQIDSKRIYLSQKNMELYLDAKKATSLIAENV